MSKSRHDLAPELEFKINQVDLLCRRRRWIRCWVRFGIATLALTVLFTALLGFSAWLEVPGIIPFVLFGLAECVAGWILLYRPLRVPMSLRQVALYIDESHPELENRILSAVEFSSGAYDDTSSPWLIEQFLQESRSFSRRISFADLVDTDVVIKLFLVAAAFILGSAMVVLVFHDLWIPRLSPRGTQTIGLVAQNLDFTVEPGDVRIRRGDHQVILVKSNKKGKKVVIQWRKGDNPWESAVMGQGTVEEVHFHQFSNVQDDITYQVQFGRQRSDNFKITTWLPPEVMAVDLIYTYPEYLGLEPKEIPNSGNITAVEGSVVQIEAFVNKKLEMAELVFESGRRLPLVEKMDSIWSTSLEVLENDKYHIALLDLEGEPSQFNLTYRIVAQRDKPPVIKIDFPRGDNEVTSIEEVPFDFAVTDDFGVDSIGLQYEIAGRREPIRVSLGDFTSSVVSSTGHYEIFLESLGLESGDLITWTIWAKDLKPGRDDYEELGDPFFLEIRPFLRQYAESVSNQQGGGGMGGNQGA
ncbi:hypothetical protein IIC65_01710, partial [Candidatus Sumerlaeota bacterium]|nr:hypothetical protein [Candidatus Sumerlaeota bacterium]